MTHPSLFDAPQMASGDYQTIEGIARTFAHSGTPFSAEQLRAALPKGLQERLTVVPNAFGQAFRKLARSGLIHKTGERVMAGRKEARGRDIPLWSGNLTEER